MRSRLGAFLFPAGCGQPIAVGGIPAMLAQLGVKMFGYEQLVAKIIGKRQKTMLHLRWFSQSFRPVWGKLMAK
jgi:predicted phage tail protein